MDESNVALSFVISLLGAWMKAMYVALSFVISLLGAWMKAMWPCLL